jgi:hypothetical protein
MNKSVITFLSLLVLHLPALAQGNNHGPRSASTRAKSVAVTGCIRQGVECLVLEPFGGGRKYSVARNVKLVVGRAYRLTGPVSDMGFCMEGLPIISPRRITPLRRRCPEAVRENVRVRMPERRAPSL